MFERFSMRARRVIFLTRMTAGRRGAATIETKHLLEALVLEDQGGLEQLLPEGGRTAHPWSIIPELPFISGDQAAVILSGVEEASQPENEIADSVDMALAEEMKVILTSAVEFADAMQDREVQPLHLLAEILSRERGDLTRVLSEAGVSRDRVLAAIRSKKYSESD